MPTNKLTDAACKKATADKPTKLYDGGSLYLFVTPTAKVWRLDYRREGRAQTHVIGPYPLIGLKEARAQRDAAKLRLAAGQPLRDEKPQVSALTLREACDQFWDARQDITDQYRLNATNALARYVYPRLGAMPVSQISRADVLAALAVIEAGGKLDYVRKVRLWLSAVLDWAVERGHTAHNVCLDINPAKAFAKKVVEHQPALEPSQMAGLWQRLGHEGQIQSAMACRLLAMTWARTGELRAMRWDEVDGSVWRVPAARMKRRKDHVVPLPTQAVALLETMRKRDPGSPFVFPNGRTLDRPMSENAVLYLLHRMGYRGQMTGHGWRSVASTWAHEHGYPTEAIEMQLAHTPEDKVAAAYNRSAYLDVRRKMLQDYADWLDSLA